MNQPWPRWYLLPLALGVLGLLLLARILFADALVVVPEDVDVVVLVSLLGITMVLAIHTLVRISMGHLRTLQLQRTRRETMAEHVRFLRRLDHELKNPLTTLRTGMSTLALTDLDAPQRQLVETMEREARRLSRLVTDLRKLAELETQPLNLQPVALDDFAATLLTLENERFTQVGRRLTIRAPEGSPHWVADEDLLALAMHNLLDNALKYTRPGDTVRVEMAVQQELIVQVSDSGSGIPPQDLPHVWEELYRASVAEKTAGSGVGLSLVKAIVERHRGKVAIESHLDQGTTVTLRLPLLSLDQLD